MTTQFIGPGVTSSGLTVSNGNLLAIGSGGETSNTTVLSGGSEDPEPNGLAIDVTVASGGYLIGKGDVGGNSNIHGTINGVTLVVSGSPQPFATTSIFSGAKSLNVTVDSGADEILISGAVASGSVVSSGGVLFAYGGARVSGATVSDGGSLVVLSGVHIADDIVVSGGSAALDSSAQGSGLVVNSGGFFLFGGVIAGGQTYIDTASVTSGSTISGVTLSSGALVVMDAMVMSGATLSLTADAPIAGQVTVSADGELSGPGRINGVYDSGTVSGVSVVSSDSPPGFLYVDAGGTAEGDTIGVNSIEHVMFGGRTDGETINSGALDNYGLASGTVVRSGLLTTFEAGGAVGTVLSAGSYEYDFGESHGSLVLSGGHEVVRFEGSTSGSVISNGGREVVSYGGVAASAIVSSGGVLILSTGGLITSGLTIEGGTVIDSGTISAGQTVSFTGTSGILQLDNLSNFQAQISGLLQPAQMIDLGGFTYSSGESVSWAQSGTSGTLTISDRARTASLTLDGSYVSGDFTLSTDSQGGTYVADPRPAAGFAQATAGFSGREQGFAAIHAGGSALMSASPLATAATSGR
jgi:autotransporter passenger strand-loop-strand repeat protein